MKVQEAQLAKKQVSIQNGQLLVGFTSRPHESFLMALCCSACAGNVIHVGDEKQNFKGQQSSTVKYSHFVRD